MTALNTAPADQLNVAHSPAATPKPASSPTASGAPPAGRRYCAVPATPRRVLGPEVNHLRASLIQLLNDKWINGRTLSYYFFDSASDGSSVVYSDGTSEFVTWTADENQKDIVRRAFDAWKQLGIGIGFREVASRGEAEIRIGFMRDDGAWSYVGSRVLDIPRNERTMNFGWDLNGPDGFDTALHEIGHTIGFPHEHQNPFAGIVWDEEAVYAALAKPPNRWDRAKTYHNIIRKIEPDTVQGSSWDRNSIMHYPFEAGLIKEPPDLRDGLWPAGGLSERDRAWVKKFYPPLTADDYAPVVAFQSVQLEIPAAGQANFVFRPAGTRTYEIGTFGSSDTIIVLFEREQGREQYLAADDDSGHDRNARIVVKLIQGHEYVIRVRLYYADRPGETALMVW